MASYRITVSFDVDNIPGEEIAQEITDVVANTLYGKYEEAFISQDRAKEGMFLGHRISNVQGHRPLIVTNE